MNYDKINKENLGKRIALSRIKAGMTQASLAILMDCKQHHIAEYEKGKIVPRDDKLKRMAEKLKIDYIWLKYGDESYYSIKDTEYKGKEININHFTNSSTIQKVTDLLKELTKDELSIVEELCEALIKDKNPKLLKEYLKNKDSEYQAQIDKAKKGKKKITPSAAAANELAAMYKHYNDVFMMMIKNEIDLEKARDLSFIKDAKKIPALAKILKSSNDEKTRVFVIDEVIKNLEK